TRDVRPILSQHCFKCHGPDDTARKAKLRLDTREAALAGGRSGDPAVVPGKPGESELVRRISSDDETEVMPPPVARKPLTAAQKEILKQWVAAGAEYAPHWAFAKPQRPPVPTLRSASRLNIRNPIDAFVLTR